MTLFEHIYIYTVQRTTQFSIRISDAHYPNGLNFPLNYKYCHNSIITSIFRWHIIKVIPLLLYNKWDSVYVLLLLLLHFCIYLQSPNIFTLVFCNINFRIYSRSTYIQYRCVFFSQIMLQNINIYCYMFSYYSFHRNAIQNPVNFLLLTWFENQELSVAIEFSSHNKSDSIRFIGLLNCTMSSSRNHRRFH